MARLAALWSDRTLLFELKTEPGSVRDGQVDSYVARALRQVDHQVDFVYLTRDEVVGAPSGEPDRFRYATMTWLDLLDVLADWAEGAPDEEQQLAAFLDEFVRGELYEGRVVVSVDRPAPSVPVRAESTRRSGNQVALEPEVPSEGAVEAAVRVAWEVEADGSGRGVNTRLTSRRAVEHLKAAAKEALSNNPPAHARPWIWCVDTSTGHALTTAGEETGFELRFEYARRGPRIDPDRPGPAAVSRRGPPACLLAA